MVITSPRGNAGLAAAYSTPTPTTAAARAGKADASAPQPGQREAPSASAVVSISRTAQDLLAGKAAGAANALYSGSAGGAGKTVWDTSKGPVQASIEDMIMPRKTDDLMSLPLLAPTPGNMRALQAHVSAKMPEFLAKNGIPVAPETVTYGPDGRVQLPDGYPYAAEFEKGLADDPVMETSMRTLNAMASWASTVEENMRFQSEYGAAASGAELDAVVAKYSQMLAGNARSAVIELRFSADGQVNLTADGKAVG